MWTRCPEPGAPAPPPHAKPEAKCGGWSGQVPVSWGTPWQVGGHEAVCVLSWGKPLLECTPSSPLRLPEGAHTLGAPQAENGVGRAGWAPSRRGAAYPST